MGDQIKGEIDEYLNSVYFNPSAPGSFTSPLKLWYAVRKDANKPKGLDLKKVKNWLKLQDTYLLHTRPRQHFPTDHYIVDFIDSEWQSDLLDMTSLAKQNRPYRYIFVLIDTFSRFLWCKLLKTKTATETAQKFEEIIQETSRAGHILLTDQGSEYRGRPFQEVLKKHKISHLLAYGPHHAAICERVNQTIEHRLYKYFTQSGTTRYVDVLDDIVYSINHTVHSTLHRTPASITKENEMEVYEQVYEKIVNKAAAQPLRYEFELGDMVRLTRARTPFHRGYKESWTQEIFVIWNRIPSRPVRYRVKDLLGEEVRGSFYSSELQKVNLSDPNSVKYTIDRILSYKTVNGTKFAKIRWYGLPPKFDSFIKKSEIKKYKRIKR